MTKFDHTTGATHPIVQRIIAGERVEQWEIHDHVATQIRKRIEAGEVWPELVELFIKHAKKATEKG